MEYLGDLLVQLIGLITSTKLLDVPLIIWLLIPLLLGLLIQFLKGKQK